MSEELKQSRDTWRSVGIWGGVLVALTGLLVLIGWYTGSEALVQLRNTFVAMQYNTALALLFAGTARLALAYDRKKAAIVFSGVVLAIGLTTLLEHMGLIPTLPIDTMLWTLGANRSLEPLISLKTTSPGRMAPNTSVCFTLSSLGMLLMASGLKDSDKGYHARALVIASVIGTFIIGLSGIALFAYLHGATPMYWWGGFTTMALHTALALAALGVSTVALAGSEIRRMGKSPATLLPALSLTGGTVLTLGIAQGLVDLAAERESLAPLYALILGAMCTAMMFQTFRYALAAKKREEELRETNVRLAVEIAERKAAEESLLKHTVELERSNEELERFAYVASHDLQEPLRMVASYTQLLQQRYKDKLGDDANQFIHFAVDGAQRMQKLIEGLLTFSRAGSQPIHMKTVDMDTIVKYTVINLSSVIKDTGALVTVEPLPKITGDEIQLTQVFQNLIGNAIKFQNGKVPEIKIRSRELADSWEFSVADNGIGIDPKNTERIFQVFKRLHTHYEYPGAGIGLSVTKKIVERHGGQIRVESQPGSGTTFYFTIPKNG